MLPIPNRNWSFPLVTGDAFRAIADWGNNENPELDSSKFKKGDILFFGTHQTQAHFLENKPKVPYILVTHNSDHSAPAQYHSQLEDPNLYAWFTQNADFAHPKIRPIPIGFMNQQWAPGNLDVLLQHGKTLGIKQTRDIFLYINISPGTNSERNAWISAIDDWKDQSGVVTVRERISNADYFAALRRARFVLSPPGNGQDCHRTYEAALLGAVPIVQSSFMNTIFAGEPVLIVDHYRHLTRELLESWKAPTKTSSMIYANRWFDEIMQTREKLVKQL